MGREKLLFGKRERLGNLEESRLLKTVTEKLKIQEVLDGGRHMRHYSKDLD